MTTQVPPMACVLLLIDIPVIYLLRHTERGNYMNFGEKIKQKRKVLNFYRTHMANTLGISVESYRRIEDGAMEEQLLIVKKIASALGLNYTYLFSNNESEFEHQRQKELR